MSAHAFRPSLPGDDQAIVGVKPGEGLVEIEVQCKVVAALLGVRLIPLPSQVACAESERKPFSKINTMHFQGLP